MQHVTIVLHPEHLEEVTGALETAGFHDMVQERIRHHGETSGVALSYQKGSIELSLVQMSEIQLPVSEENRDSVIETVKDHARDGKVGGYQIFTWSDTPSNRLNLKEEDGE